MDTEKIEQPDEPENEMVQIEETQIERVEESSQDMDAPKPRWWKKFKPGYKREVQLQSMQTGYQEVLGLVRSMRDNLDGQMESQKLLVEFMGELPGVAEGLKNVGKATEQQKEMLTAIKGQMESNLTHNLTISSNMEKFNDTLFTMDDTTRKILEGARASEDSLKDMLERSERRLVFLTTFLIIAILGVGGGLFYMIYNGDIDLEKFRASMNRPKVEQQVHAPGSEHLETEEATATLSNKVVVAEKPERVIPTNRIVEVQKIYKMDKKTAIVADQANEQSNPAADNSSAVDSPSGAAVPKAAVSNEVVDALKAVEAEVKSTEKSKRKWLGLFSRKTEKSVEKAEEVVVEETEESAEKVKENEVEPAENTEEAASEKVEKTTKSESADS